MDAAKGLGGRKYFLARIRFQLLSGLFFAIFLPALVRGISNPAALATNHMQVTFTAAAIAHVIGFYCWRRMGIFPGVAAASNVLPAFVLSYGAVFLTIFFLRLDYSRFQAAGSFCLSTLWYFALAMAIRRIEPYRLGVVPIGDIERLWLIPGVDWVRLMPGESARNFRGVVADLRSNLPAEWERFITDCALSGIPVYHVKQVSESLTGRVEIEHLSENTLGSLDPNQAYLKVKQIIDWLGALLVGLIFMPLFLVVMLAIRLDSAGPVLFRQARVGYRGKTFIVYKFRSMHVDNGEGNDREKAITRTGDARITRTGGFLRRSRIDELPQLINILRGEMSWIGPRPEAVALSDWYEKELRFYRYRHIVRPGITGWAQVNQGHVAAVDEVRDKLHYDFYYIKNFSPWLDLVIVLKTIRTMLTGFGAR